MSGLFEFSDSLTTSSLRLDSYNKVYQWRFQSNRPGVEKYFDFIVSYSLDKNIDDLLPTFAQDIILLLKNEYPNLEQKDFFEIDYCVLYAKSVLANYIGQVTFDKTHDLDKELIICRCAKYDQKKFDKLFEITQGKKKEFIKASNISSFCGGCKNLVNERFEYLEEKNNILEGEKLDFWSSHIIKLVSDFKIDLDDKYICKVSQIDIPNIVISIENISEEKRLDVTKNLSHKIDSQLPFRASLSFVYL